MMTKIPEQLPFAKTWYNKDGKLHREDGPAIEYKDGSKSWLLNGVYHREDGPAMDFVGGGSYWVLNGVYHREDGPAIEYANGEKLWFLNGKSLTESKWKKSC